jgi:hypothetical protein
MFIFLLEETVAEGLYLECVEAVGHVNSVMTLLNTRAIEKPRRFFCHFLAESV